MERPRRYLRTNNTPPAACATPSPASARSSSITTCRRVRTAHPNSLGSGMFCILLEFFQTLARTEVQCLRSALQLLGEFGGNEHSAHRVASRLALMWTSR